MNFRKNSFKKILIIMFVIITGLLYSIKYQDFIKTKLADLGFSIGKIFSLKPDSFQVRINKFKSTPILTLNKPFKPFYLQVKIKQGKLQFNKLALVNKGFQFHTRQLPSGIIFTKFKTFTALGPINTQPGLEDPVIRRMNFCLSKVKNYQEMSPIKINEIKEQVQISQTAINNCPEPPPPDPSRVSPSRPILPRFGLYSLPIRIPYLGGGIGRCDHFPGNAEIGLRNAAGYYHFLRNLLSDVISLKNWITDRCRQGNLSHSEKEYLNNTLIRFQQDAEGQADKFDPFIADIERFINQYQECLARQDESDPIY